MKIIFLRGSTSVGKTEIAHLLEDKLSDSVVIHLDDFNIKTTEKNTPSSVYEKILEKMNLIYEKDKQYLIVEGIIWDKILLDKLNVFVNKNNILSFWFMIKRSQSKIKLSKKGAMKNPPEKLLKIQEKLDALKIENEKIILNNEDVNEAANSILNSIESYSKNPPSP